MRARKNIKMRNPSKGLSIVEALLSLGLMGLTGVFVSQTLDDQNKAQRALNSADVMSTIKNASDGYLRTYYQKLIVAVPADGVSAISIPVGRPIAGAPIPVGTLPGLPSLQESGLLVPNFIDRDAFRMHHKLLIRQPVAGTLEGLVVQVDSSAFPGASGALPGTIIRDADLGRMINKMESAGGARFSNNPNPANANIVQGNAGSWSSSADNWASSGVTPLAGRAAATLTFGNSGLSSDFLNRYDIGIKEANSMETSIDMKKNDVNNAGTVTATKQLIAGQGNNLDSSGAILDQSLIMGNGGYACAQNATGCQFWISKDGYFNNANTGFVEFQGTKAGGGLSLTGPGNNLIVGGNSSVTGDSSVTGSLNVTGYTSTDSLNVTNRSGVGSLHVDGLTFLNENVRAGKELYVMGSTTIGSPTQGPIDPLTLTPPAGIPGKNIGFPAPVQSSTQSSQLYVYGPVISLDSLRTSGIIQADGDILSYNGAIYSKNGVSTYGVLTAGGQISTDDYVIAQKGVITTGTIDSTGNINTSDTITSKGDISTFGVFNQNGQTISDIAKAMYNSCYASPGPCR